MGGPGFLPPDGPRSTGIVTGAREHHRNSPCRASLRGGAGAGLVHLGTAGSGRDIRAVVCVAREAWRVLDRDGRVCGVVTLAAGATDCAVLGALIQRIKQMGGGEYSALLPSSSNRVSGIEEIDRLAASFDELTERLELASQAKAQYLRRVEQANADLATSEEHYRLLWDHSVDTKILVDPLGVIQAMNRRGELTLADRLDPRSPSGSRTRG